MTRIETRIVASVAPEPLQSRQVAQHFRRLLREGHELRPAGSARKRPLRLLSSGYTPKYSVRLFATTYHLAPLRQDANFRFFVGYVQTDGRLEIHPRIFYKDSSLVWRSPTHFIRSASENWIGKGEEKLVVSDGEERLESAEETTNLPLEVQAAFDVISRRSSRVVRDERAIGLVLRRAPGDRYEPYADFRAPRRRAMADARNLVNGGRPVARLTREGDPASLRFARGFEPDFDRGFLDVGRSRSRLYGGAVRKYRFASVNRRIQYQFIASPRLVWIIPPQPFTTEIMSYGVRTVDVEVDEGLCIPGYEYHFIDESVSPPELYSQIPEGFAGSASDVDPSRYDAAPWLDALPVIREFREKFGRRRSAGHQKGCSAVTSRLGRSPRS